MSHPTASPPDNARQPIRLKTMPKEAVLQLVPFEGLRLDQIVLPDSDAARCQARAALLASPFLGFDTEVKPTFKAGEPMRGPDVVQFATGTHAYVFQMHDDDNTELVREVLAARGVVKAGFDLRSDQKQLMHRLGSYAQPLLDLDFVFSGRGYPRSIGVKAAIALLFNRRLLKSKRVTTSNWANPTLEPRQVLYAANDAYAAWAVLNALGLPLDELPVWTGDAS
ncbi:MAG: 3'-5' exonuclease domain-containing protein 2 [Burkholderiaceae bacterium]